MITLARYQGSFNMNMYAVILIAAFASAVSAQEKFCYNDAVTACVKSKSTHETVNCNARFGGFTNKLNEELQVYANNHFNRSFEFLLMSTHYANYDKNRPGFAKLFRSLSDKAWNDGIELIKYMTKRGGSMNFFNTGAVHTDTAGNYELYEYEAIAKALDIEKQLADEANRIHMISSRKSEEPKMHYDAGVATYLQEEFVEHHADIVRKLAGYTTELKKLLSEPERSVGLYLFDEYLQKE